LKSQSLKSSDSSKASQIVLFLTVFLYLLGFGILIPLIPHLGRDLGATSTQAGFLMATYSLMQFLFAPFWGRLSDQLGRRKIILICLAMEVFAYIGFAWARSLEMLFVMRALTGFFGASLSTANAAMADVTAKKERSKGMALIGAAFGLGFVFGPAIGGGLSILSESFSTEPFFRTTFVSLCVSGLFLITFIFAYFKFPETLSSENRNTKGSHKLTALFDKLKDAKLRPLILSFFFLTFAMASMEATLVYFMADRFLWNLKETSFGFAFIGIILVFTQGYLVRKLLPKWGEKKILLVFVPLFILGMALIAPAQNLWVMTLSMTLIALGIGHANPSLTGSISLLSPENEQGSTSGVTQSLSSLGRILGPSIGGILYSFNAGGPFWFSTGLAIFALLLIYLNRKIIPDKAKE
jgi:DHA1 family tetracycline resistance protein-like MFS transporter